ncbi:THAP domain-containing protein 1-like [Aphis gossypii]|uniref:THAP domain-containing protein 1-like n=1 Tax=Aphis gossypii TaxID=80765 RepID=UPI00215982F1|nr:THAP domain-containing protein 1-like [Aphis gossypii]
MVISCSSYGCTNRRKKGCGIQFHRFPLKRPSVLEKWIHEMKRKNFKPSEYSYLCSEHFTNEDYQIRPGANVKWLKDEAVPSSVFKEFPQHLQKKKVVRRLLQRNPLVENNCDISVDTVDIQCSSSTILKIILKVFSVPYNRQQKQF